eukprot:9163939-Pyramimonas_sp.AAC.1
MMRKHVVSARSRPECFPKRPIPSHPIGPHPWYMPHPLLSLGGCSQQRVYTLAAIKVMGRANHTRQNRLSGSHAAHSTPLSSLKP